MKLAATQIKAGVEYPLLQLLRQEPEGAAWTLELPSLGVTLNASDRLPHALAFAGLLGYLLSSSCVSQTAKQSCLRLGHRLDAEWVLRDIQLLTGVQAAPAKKTTTRVTLPAALHQAMQHVGVNADERLFPGFLLADTCPPAVVQAFLSGLFGSDGEAPSLRWGAAGRVTALTEVRLIRHFSGVCSGAERELTTQLKSLFTRVGLSADAICLVPSKAHGADSSKGSAGQVWRVSRQSTLAFTGAVGFRYASAKQLQLTAAATYHRMQSTLLRRQAVFHGAACASPLSVHDALEASDCIKLFGKAGLPPASRVLPTFRVQVVGRRAVPGVRPVFDLTVPDTENFQVAGLVGHNCKTTKEPLLLYFCASLVKKGANLKKCRKKYCEGCLRRLYAPEFADGGRWWSCPACKGCCVCASCERKVTGKAAPKKIKHGHNKSDSVGGGSRKGTPVLQAMHHQHFMDDDDGSFAGAGLHHPAQFALDSSYSGPDASGLSAAAMQQPHPTPPARLSGHKRTLTDELSAFDPDAVERPNFGPVPSGNTASGVAGRTPTKIRSRSNSAVLDREGINELWQQQQQQEHGYSRPTAAQVFAARHGIHPSRNASGGIGLQEDFSPLSPLTGSGLHGAAAGSGRNSPVQQQRLFGLKHAALHRAGSHGELLQQHSPMHGHRSRKGSLPSSRGTTPPLHAINGASATADQFANSSMTMPPNHRAATMGDMDSSYGAAAQGATASSSQRMRPQPQSSPRFPPVHGNSPSMHAPLSPSMGALSASVSHSRRRSSAGSASPFMGALGGGSGLSSNLHSSTSSSAAVSDHSSGGSSSDVDATSPSHAPTRSMTPPHLGGGGSNISIGIGHCTTKLQEYLSMQDEGIPSHAQPQPPPLLTHPQLAPPHVLLSPPGMTLAQGLMSPSFPSGFDMGGHGGGVGGGAGGMMFSGALASPVTIAGMTAADLSQLSLGELQAINEQIEQQLHALTGQPSSNSNGTGGAGPAGGALPPSLPVSAAPSPTMAMDDPSSSMPMTLVASPLPGGSVPTMPMHASAASAQFQTPLQSHLQPHGGNGVAAMLMSPQVEQTLPLPQPDQSWWAVVASSP